MCALLELVTLYLQLMSNGFACPLLYRWKYAEASQRYVRDGMILHQLLPRTLSRMSVKPTHSQQYRINELVAAARLQEHPFDLDVMVDAIEDATLVKSIMVPQ